MPRMQALVKALLFAPLLLLTLLACNLTNVPPTQTPQPTAIPLILPTTPPIVAPGTLLTTPIGGTGAGTSTCALTPPTWIPYTVQPGDSLGAISVAVDAPLPELVANNCLADANALFVDQVIYLPRLP